MMRRLLPVLRRKALSFGEATAYYAKGTYRFADEHTVFLVSAGIAFNVLMCSVPLLFVLIYGLGQFVEWQSVYVVVDRRLVDVIPNITFRATIMDALRSQIDAILQSHRLAGFAGLVGAAWAATALFSSLRTAINRIYGLRAPKFFALYKLYDLLLLLLLGVLVIAGTAAIPIAAVLRGVGQSYIPPALEGLTESFATGVLSLALSFALFYMLYRHFAHSLMPVRSAVVGAAAATVLWECARLGFTFYLSSFHLLGLLYGAYTFLVVLALWFYYSALVFVLGGILTKLHWDRSTTRSAS